MMVFSGTLDSGVFEKTRRSTAERCVAAGRALMARLPLVVAALIGCAYWTTT